MAKPSKKAVRKKPSKKVLRERALKGWDTRRARQAEALRPIVQRAKVLAANAEKALGKKPRKPKAPKPGISLYELQEQLRIAEAKIAKFVAHQEYEAEVQRVLEHTQDWVPTRITQPEWLNRDGTLALMPSRLRLLDEADHLRGLLEKAKESSVADFEDMADRMAMVYDLPIQEVYTLFFSP